MSHSKELRGEKMRNVVKIIGPRTRCGQDIEIALGMVTGEETMDKLEALGMFTCPCYSIKDCSHPCLFSPLDWKIDDSEIPKAEEQEAGARHYAMLNHL
jgi:hypothetical protein